MTEPLATRVARLEDAYALWIWANDPETRSASYGRPPISWTEHRRWLQERLEDPLHLILLAEDAEERPIGTIRFDTDDDWRNARLSYLVAPEARGGGLSAPIVAAGVERLRALHAGVNIWADVLPKNARSMRVFLRLGWREESPGDTPARFWLR